MTALIALCLLQYDKIVLEKIAPVEYAYVEKTERLRGFKKLWISQCVAKKQVGYE